MSWQHLNDKTPRARRRYRCYLCGAAIEIGEVYLRRTGVADCAMVSAKMHITCEEKTREWDEMDWETFLSGDLKEWV